MWWHFVRHLVLHHSKRNTMLCCTKSHSNHTYLLVLIIETVLFLFYFEGHDIFAILCRFFISWIYYFLLRILVSGLHHGQYVRRRYSSKIMDGVIMHSLLWKQLNTTKVQWKQILLLEKLWNSTYCQGYFIVPVVQGLRKLTGWRSSRIGWRMIVHLIESSCQERRMIKS